MNNLCLISGMLISTAQAWCREEMLHPVMHPAVDRLDVSLQPIYTIIGSAKQTLLDSWVPYLL